MHPHSQKINNIAIDVCGSCCFSVQSRLFRVELINCSGGAADSPQNIVQTVWTACLSERSLNLGSRRGMGDLRLSGIAQLRVEECAHPWDPEIFQLQISVEVEGMKDAKWNQNCGSCFRVMLTSFFFWSYGPCPVYAWQKWTCRDTLVKITRFSKGAQPASGESGVHSGVHKHAETLTPHHLSLCDWGYVNIAKNTVAQVIG